MADFWKDKRVLVTGGAGFLGSHLVEMLKEKRGVGEITIPRKKDYDLREKENCHRVVEGMDAVFHLAGTVGGIGANTEKPGTFFYDNLTMGVNMMEEARLAGVEKFINVGSACSYPKYTNVPFKEEDLWNGYPDETNAPMGVAKKVLTVMSDAYRRQYGFNSINLIPFNLYGPGDNFDLNSSHVIPALIRKCLESKEELIVWGDGSPTRSFVYVEDAACGLVLAAEKYNSSDPVNLGSDEEVSIRELVDLIVEYTGFGGKIRYDTSKPNGQPRRVADTSKALKLFGFKAETPFKTGLKKTIEWYKNNRNQ